MAAASAGVAGLPDPVGEVVDGWVRPNGLRVERVRVPLGVIGVIYENRPNVTQRRGRALPQVGNAVLLRGSSSAARVEPGRSPRRCATGSTKAGLPVDAVGLVEDSLPRLGHRVHAARRGHRLPHPPRAVRRSLRDPCEHATVPFVLDGAGNCHVYVDAATDLDMAEAIVVNAKTSASRGLQRGRDRCSSTGRSPKTFLPRVRGCDGRGRAGGRRRPRARSPRASGTATEEDFATEFLAIDADGRGRRRPRRRDRPHRAFRHRPLRGDRDRRPATRRPASCTRSTRPRCWSTPRHGSSTARSSGSVPRSASRPRSCTPGARWACASSPRSSSWCTGDGQVRR